MKTLDAVLDAMLNDVKGRACLLAQLHLGITASPSTTIERYTSSGHNIYWDEDGGGEQEYEGVGRFLSFDSVPEGVENQNYIITINLTGVPSTNITQALQVNYKNNPIFIWLAALDEDGTTVSFTTNPEDGPLLLFAGRMDVMTINFQPGVATISLSCTSRLADWERIRGGRYNHPDQIRRIDANDEGFIYVNSIQEQDIIWGGVRPSQGGGGGQRDTPFDEILP